MNRYLIFIVLLVVELMLSCGNVDKKQSTQCTEGTEVLIGDNDTVGITPSVNSNAIIYQRREVPVLCYHRIEYVIKGDYTVSPENFESQIKLLADSGFHSIDPEQLYDYLVYNKELPENPFLITFDDSRVQHVLIAAPVLEKYGFRGVFFIMTITCNKKNYLSIDQISQMANNGHAIGLHSWDHTTVDHYTTDADWEKQVIRPKQMLEKATGQDVICWAYPNGVYDQNSAKKLSEYFKLSFTLNKRDSIFPLQSVRRIIVPNCTPQGLMKIINRASSRKS